MLTLPCVFVLLSVYVANGLPVQSSPFGSDCAVNACSNGGTCVPSTIQPRGFFCLCTRYYQGDNCEVDREECLRRTPNTILCPPADPSKSANSNGASPTAPTQTTTTEAADGTDTTTVTTTTSPDATTGNLIRAQVGTNAKVSAGASGVPKELTPPVNPKELTPLVNPKELTPPVHPTDQQPSAPTGAGCATNTCQNGASCLPDPSIPRGYYCECSTYFAGDDCQDDRDACLKRFPNSNFCPPARPTGAAGAPVPGVPPKPDTQLPTIPNLAPARPTGPVIPPQGPNVPRVVPALVPGFPQNSEEESTTTATTQTTTQQTGDESSEVPANPNPIVPHSAPGSPGPDTLPHAVPNWPTVDAKQTLPGIHPLTGNAPQPLSPQVNANTNVGLSSNAGVNPIPPLGAPIRPIGSPLGTVPVGAPSPLLNQAADDNEDH